MNAVIISCSSLKGYIEAAQHKAKTEYPIMYIDRKYHSEPKTMRERIIAAERNIQRNYDTILVAMGFCGGSFDNLSFSRRIVIPRIDDCVSILLQNTDEFIPNLKKAGHMYMMETNPKEFDFTKMFPAGFADYSEEDLIELYDILFANYSYLDIVDTGLNNCHSEEYVRQANKNAEIMKVDIEYVEGGNHIIEKLVSGYWDEQFLVLEPGRITNSKDFL